MKKKGSRGKGNRSVQQRNRRRNNKGIPKQKELYCMIDGNYTYYPYAYCYYYQGFLTKNMQERHSCSKKNCHNFKILKKFS